MTDVFVKILNLGIAAGWLVPVVLLLRLVLKKAPRWISCALWGLIALRLLVPVAVESPVSLMPSVEFIPENIVQMAQPEIDSGFSAINDAVNPYLSREKDPGTPPLEVVFRTASVIWLAGMAAMALYSAVTWLSLRWRLRASLRLKDNVYCCDAVESPFILGTLRPGIYLPSGLPREQTEHVLAHENAHLARRDHWWNPLGFLLLTVYWFQPLLWVAYIFLCRDIEAACDEKVIKAMDAKGKVGYSETLVACSVHRRQILACPLAFGEVGVKERIRAVLNYKKPAFWVIMGAVAVCCVAAVCFLTDPVPCEHTYEATLTLAPTCAVSGVQTFSCSQCPDSYTEPVPILAHTYGEAVEIQPATCTAQGSQEAACTGCGDVKTEPIAMLAHSFGEAAVTKEPNCSETGEKSATCTVCAQTHVVQTLEKKRCP